MDQARSRALPRPVGASGTTLVSNGRFYEEGPDVEAEVDALEAAIALKANAANPVFTGTPTFPDGSIPQADVSGLVSALALKAPLASPTLTGTTTTSTLTANGATTLNSTVRITETGTSAVVVEKDDGTDLLRFDTTNAQFALVNDTDLLLFTDNGTDAVFEVDGNNGNTTIDGTLTVAGTAFTSKVNDTGDTITGLLVLRGDLTSLLTLEKASGLDAIRVSTDLATSSLYLVNATDLVVFSDDGATPKFSVDGATGDTLVKGVIDHDGTTLGFYGATPVAQPAANPDTSGAALADLETEVNQLKAMLRSVGLLAT